MNAAKTDVHSVLRFRAYIAFRDLVSVGVWDRNTKCMDNKFKAIYSKIGGTIFM